MLQPNSRVFGRLVAALLVVAAGATGRGAAPDSCGAVLHSRLLEDTPFETPVYLLGDLAGFTVLLVGGVHGDEPAGHLAAQQVVDEGAAVAGIRLVVIPSANRPALERGLRTSAGDPNLNRVFPGNPLGHPLERLAHRIVSLIEELDVRFVIDLHESGRSIFDDESRLGDTVIFNARDEALLVAVHLEAWVADAHPELRLALLSPPVAGSLVAASGPLGVPAVMVESDRSQELAYRVAYHRAVLAGLLDGIVALP